MLDLTRLVFAYLVMVDLRNWMHILPHEIKQRPLNQLCIPGTHNSASHDCSHRNGLGKDAERILKYLPAKLIQRWAKCQRVSPLQQLNDGIRYLDIRLSMNRGVVNICHGLNSISWDELISELNEFILSTRSEVIILDVNHLYGFNQLGDHIFVIESMITKIGRNKIANRSLNPTLTLQELMDNGIRLVFIYENAPIAKDYDVWDLGQIQSPWPNSSNFDHVYKVIHTGLKTRHFSSLHVCQFVYTVGHSEIITSLVPFSKTPKTIMEFGAKLTLNTHEYLAEMKSRPNIIIVDDYRLNGNSFVSTIVNQNHSQQA